MRAHAELHNRVAGMQWVVWGRQLIQPEKEMGAEVCYLAKASAVKMGEVGLCILAATCSQKRFLLQCL